MRLRWVRDMFRIQFGFFPIFQRKAGMHAAASLTTRSLRLLQRYSRLCRGCLTLTVGGERSIRA